VERAAPAVIWINLRRFMVFRLSPS
jgi:hypothetical protein